MFSSVIQFKSEGSFLVSSVLVAVEVFLGGAGRPVPDSCRCVESPSESCLALLAHMANVTPRETVVSLIVPFRFTVVQV